MSYFSFSRVTTISLLAIFTSFTIACNNDPKSDGNDEHMKGDTTMTGAVSKPASDTINSIPAQSVIVDSATGLFLTKAADGGLAEVAAAKLADRKATDAGVKRFAQLMMQDHGEWNKQVKALAEKRSINLPLEPSVLNKNNLANVEKKGKKGFDKAYIDRMVEDHRTTISLFEDALAKTPDDAVKTFITATLPTLKMHLDSALAISGKLGK